MQTLLVAGSSMAATRLWARSTTPSSTRSRSRSALCQPPWRGCAALGLLRKRQFCGLNKPRFQGSWRVSFRSCWMERARTSACPTLLPPPPI